MFRYLLVTHMLLLSLTGPNPCCCTFARIASKVASWGGLSESKDVLRLSCCKDQFGSTIDVQPDESQPEARQLVPKVPAERCRCEKSLCNGVPAQRVDVVGEQSRSWLDDVCRNLAAPLVLETDDFFSMVVHPDETPPATRSGREIRVALHSWQC